jgi:hypothetical protein
MKICTHCILPETFPGIRFNKKGLCSNCQNFNDKELKLSADRKKYEQKFHDLLRKFTRQSKNRRPYDIIMAYSGGKDSTYAMGLFKNKFQLRILAVSFDNGFISGTTIVNMKRVTDTLGIDHIFFKPKWDILKKIFTLASTQELYPRKSLERASTICTSCIGLVKSICLKTAIEQDIPMVGFGWSPGQAPVQSSVMKTNPSLVRMSQEALLKPLKKGIGDEIEVYFLQAMHYSAPDKFPYNVHLLSWEFYNEEMILNEIYKFGWVPPNDTDSNSSNCLLNAFANEIHMQRYGFHPYVWEIANMVRRGIMTREDGYRKIYQKQSGDLVHIAREKLGI